MKIEALKKVYGPEYPAAVVMNGVRMAMRAERRFSRSYRSEADKTGTSVSRFMDSTASITAKELSQEWPAWDQDTRIDFCQACCWLREQPDYPEMLRFVMKHGGTVEWSAVALGVAGHLPQEEAFNSLLAALRETAIGRTANITQAIAGTKHPSAEGTLRRHLQAIWVDAALWDDDKFLNWVAFDAATCIGHMIELGVAPAEFEDQVRRLSRHVCGRNQESCRHFLSKHYTWLQ